MKKIKVQVVIRMFGGHVESISLHMTEASALADINAYLGKKFKSAAAIGAWQLDNVQTDKAFAQWFESDLKI